MAAPTPATAPAAPHGWSTQRLIDAAEFPGAPTFAPVAPMNLQFAWATPPASISGWAPMALAFEPQDASAAAERARENAERVREQQERVREQAERAREMVDRSTDTYRAGKSALDNKDYERAVRSFQRVIETKSPNIEGAYYFKAYALYKLGKKDEALAACAELLKQFPQSRWKNDIEALRVEIQQPSPDSVNDEEMKLLALTSLLNADQEKAIPILEKILNDPKSSVQFKRRAMYVLAQRGSERSRELLGKYAKSGGNPDLQLAAVMYLGQFRGKENRQILAEVYSTGDVNMKRACIRAFADAQDSENLLKAARGEQNAELRQEAIRGLGNMRAITELAQLYASESNADLKMAIIRAISNAGGVEALLNIIKSDKDNNLRGVAIRDLGNVRREKSGEALAGLYGSESDKAIKHEILRSLYMQGSAKLLIDCLRKESDQQLKRDGVQYLSQMRNSKEATDFLVELLNK
jgi:tetratricopeptide (TPR) repeat protein